MHLMKPIDGDELRAAVLEMARRCSTRSDRPDVAEL
jgi:hypothetical protein